MTSYKYTIEKTTLGEDELLTYQKMLKSITRLKGSGRNFNNNNDRESEAGILFGKTKPNSEFPDLNLLTPLCVDQMVRLTSHKSRNVFVKVACKGKRKYQFVGKIGYEKCTNHCIVYWDPNIEYNFTDLQCRFELGQQCKDFENFALTLIKLIVFAFPQKFSLVQETSEPVDSGIISESSSFSQFLLCDYYHPSMSDMSPRNSHSELP